MPPKRDLIGSAEACSLIGIDRATLTRWVQAGKLSYSVKLPGANGAYLFERVVIERAARDRARAA